MFLLLLWFVLLFQWFQLKQAVNVQNKQRFLDEAHFIFDVVSILLTVTLSHISA